MSQLVVQIELSSADNKNPELRNELLIWCFAIIFFEEPHFSEFVIGKIFI